MTDIYEFLERHFLWSLPRTIIEVGAHDGADTIRLAAIPGVEVHAFEPDPRPVPPRRINIHVERCAVGASDGTFAHFYPSATRGGVPWTCSGSLREPTGHLEAYPDVTFGPRIMVEVVSLDAYCARHGIGAVDLLWLDVQGAEGDVIAGARETLARTRYLYTEACDVELYEGQVTRAQLLAMLPGWRVLHEWPSNAEVNLLLERVAS
jgi:2-O-methyltransferase